MTQKEFAKQVGVLPSTLSGIILGKSPTAETLNRFSNLGINTHWLITGKGKPFFIDTENNPPGPERTNTALEEAGEAPLRAAQTPGQEREQLKNELQTALNQVAGTPMELETQQTPRPVMVERPEQVDLFDLLYRAMDLLSKEELEVLKFMLERKLKIKAN